MSADYSVCARIVAQAIYGIPGRRIGVLDEDDLRQELLPHALRGAELHDGREGHGYIRTCVRNAIRDLYAHTLAAKRHPQDRYGRPVAFSNPDVLAWQADLSPDPEQTSILRDRVSRLEKQLPDAEKALIRRCARGESELSEHDARHIRYLLNAGGFHDEEE